MKFSVGDKVKIKKTINNFYQGKTLQKHTVGTVVAVHTKPAYSKTPYSVTFQGFPTSYFAENELKK